MTVKTSRTIWRLPGLGTRAATFVVAASNSSPQSKAQADYVCDGVDDQVEIQRAIDSLPVGGGRVLLLEGGFILSNSIILDDRVSLYGMGVESTNLFLANNSNASVLKTATGRQHWFIQVGHLAIDGNKANQTAGHGIDFFGANHTILESILVQNVKEDGIRFDASAEHMGVSSWLNQVSIKDNDGNGFHTASFFVCDNFLLNCNIGRNGLDGIFLNGAVNIIYGGETWRHKRVGVRVGLGAWGTRIIAFSTFENDEDGISIFEADRVIIQGCLVRENSLAVPGTKSGIAIGGSAAEASEDIIIANSLIYGAKQQFGINIWNPHCANVLIVGNNLHGNMSPLNVNGINHIIKNNHGYVTENSGTATFSGDGVATSFTFAHGLANTPTVVHLEAKSADASGDKFWSADSVNITVTFVTAPPAGINNVILGWEAKIS